MLPIFHVRQLPAQGLVYVCTQCRTPLTRGTRFITVEVDGVDKSIATMMRCSSCGVNYETVLLFDESDASPGSAEAVRRLVEWCFLSAFGEGNPFRPVDRDVRKDHRSVTRKNR